MILHLPADSRSALRSTVMRRCTDYRCVRCCLAALALTAAAVSAGAGVDADADVGFVRCDPGEGAGPRLVHQVPRERSASSGSRRRTSPRSKRCIASPRRRRSPTGSACAASSGTTSARSATSRRRPSTAATASWPASRASRATAAAADWVELHSDYGGPNVTKAAETPEHRRERIERSIAAGMNNPANLYLVARQCLACHTSPNERLVNVGGHAAGSAEFELVAWSQGKVRHNFLRTDGAANAPSSPERLRVMFVVGVMADLEASLRATAAASEKAAFGVAAAQRAARQKRRLYEISQLVENPQVHAAMQAALGVRLKLNNREALVAAADEIGKAAYRVRRDGRRRVARGDRPAAADAGAIQVGESADSSASWHVHDPRLVDMEVAAHSAAALGCARSATRCATPTSTVCWRSSRFASIDPARFPPTLPLREILRNDARLLRFTRRRHHRPRRRLRPQRVSHPERPRARGARGLSPEALGRRGADEARLARQRCCACCGSRGCRRCAEAATTRIDDPLPTSDGHPIGSAAIRIGRECSCRTCRGCSSKPTRSMLEAGRNLRRARGAHAQPALGDGVRRRRRRAAGNPLAGPARPHAADRRPAAAHRTALPREQLAGSPARDAAAGRAAAGADRRGGRCDGV